MNKAKCGCLYEGAVQFCSLHAAAELMLRVLKRILKYERALLPRTHTAINEALALAEPQKDKP
jgi:hypothetical protein